MEEFIKAFLNWFKNDNHSKIEDFYVEKVTFGKLRSLSKSEFVEFFDQFAREGGQIQSGGHRTAPQFIENVNQKFDEFKAKILEPFSPSFDLDSWLEWSVNFPFFGKGLATIYLNRIDKHKYVVVNNKSVSGLKKLGYKIPSSSLKSQYDAILVSERFLLEKFSALENFFRIDALMHYIIGTEEGRDLFDTTISKDYFDLKGFREYAQYFGATYEGDSPAVKWYYDTRKKLEYLVTLLSEKLKRNYTINYKERPNNQAGKLKSYVLTGFSPDGSFLRGELFIKLAFHSLNNSPVFDIEIDVDSKIENNPFKKDRKERTEKTKKSIPVDQNFPNSWDTLLDKISGHVETLTQEYQKISPMKETTESRIEKTGSLNKILYGPPGTGKTYHSINYAVSIVENKPVDKIIEEKRSMVKERFEQYIEEGTIAFCTFHQSLGYEDFIEGIKPIEPNSEDEQLSYAVEDGIFKKMCTDASFSFVKQNRTAETAIVLDFSSEYDQYVDNVNESLVKGEKVELETRSGGKVYVDSISERNNIRIKHVDGTRDYIVSKKRLSKIAQTYPNLSEVTNINNQFRAEIGGSNSSAYWAVLNAIRNHSNEVPLEKLKAKSEKEYLYDDKKRIIDTLKNDDYKVENPKQYVIIIDEINRGNVSQVFGELITLIEDDKRLGGGEALKAILPYSKESFGIPCNLHIIGTMNTADRSVEALDTALRRRFSFINMAPEPDRLQITDDEINLAELLKVLNNRLSILKDNDHTIGHAWLWNVKNVDQLREVFSNKLLPLLKEFFYNDYEKLGLVLGDAFFKPYLQVNSNMFARFSGGNGLAAQYDQSWLYQLKPVDELTINDFKSLEKQTTQSVTDEES